MLDIVRATSTANPGFLQLLSQVFVERSMTMPDRQALDRLEAAVRTDRVRYYMALRDNRVIGVVSLMFGFSTLLMRPQAMVGDLYVHPGHRGIGAAARLLLAAMDGAHELGCVELSTDLGDTMEGLFDRFGWHHTKAHMVTTIDPAGPKPSLKVTGSIIFD